MSALGLVVERELREAFRRRSFWIIVAVLFLGSCAGMILPEVLGGGGTARYDVGVVRGGQALQDAVVRAASTLDVHVQVRDVDDRRQATRLVREERLDIAADAGADPLVIVKAGANERLQAAVQQALGQVTTEARLARAGLTRDQVADVLATPAPTVRELDAGRSDRRGAAAIVSILLYILLLTLMIQVANGTAIEKANRISEVLLAIVRPRALLFGKVIGVGIIGVLTLLGGVVPVIVKLVAGGDLPDGLAGAMAGGGAWFALGIALYLVLAGALGALVERQEEAGSAVAPLSMILIGSYLVAQSAPDSPVARVLAYIPLSSPLVRPSRLALGEASGVEMVISLALLLAAVVVVGRVGATVYRRAVVRTGRRLKLREVLRS
jgi:ABC-2 type transport system permease protein